MTNGGGGHDRETWVQRFAKKQQKNIKCKIEMCSREMQKEIGGEFRLKVRFVKTK